jgi:hypothetical protein
MGMNTPERYRYAADALINSCSNYTRTGVYLGRTLVIAPGTIPFYVTYILARH